MWLSERGIFRATSRCSCFGDTASAVPRNQIPKYLELAEIPNNAVIQTARVTWGVSPRVADENGSSERLIAFANDGDHFTAPENRTGARTRPYRMFSVLVEGRSHHCAITKVFCGETTPAPRRARACSCSICFPLYRLRPSARPRQARNTALTGDADQGRKNLPLVTPM